jgi:hypothetical protein
MRTLRGILDSRRRDEAGATFIFAVAAMLLLLVPVCAYMLTIGATTENNVALQSLADAGAYDAAQSINSSTGVTSALANALTENAGDITGASLTPTQGCYTSGTFSATTCSSNGDYNAVKVIASKGHPTFLFGGPSLSRTAIVTQQPTADLSVGTYLATVNTDQATVLNDLFDKVPGYSGSNLGISALSYQSGLLGTNVTLQQLINSSSGVLSTSNVVSSSTAITYANWAKWVYEAATGNTSLTCTPAPTNTIALVACTFQSDTSTVSLCSLVAMLGCSNNTNTITAGAVVPGELSQNISVYTLLDDAALQAREASGSSALNVTGGIGSGGLLSGLSSATLSISAIQPPQEADGAPGSTKATSAQASVTLNLSLLGLGLGLTSGSVTFTAANGSASLTSLDCSNGTVDTATVTAATNAASATFNGGLAGLTLTVEALPSSKTLTFINTPDALLPPPGSGTGNNANPQTFSFGSGGTGDLVDVSGSITGLLGGLLGTLTGILTGLSSDATGLGPVFQALGLSIAGENVTLQSANCSAVELVK